MSRTTDESQLAGQTQGGVWYLRPVFVVALLAALAGAAVLAWPVHATAEGASAGIETASALSALIAAGLLLGCFSRSRRLRDVLLLGALASSALTDLAFAVAPALAGIDRPVAGSSARIALGVLVALVFASAALAPARGVAAGLRRPLMLLAAGGVATVVVAELIDLATGAGPVTGTLRPSQVPVLAHAPFALAALVGSAVILGVAGLAYAARPLEGPRDAALLAGAAFFFAAARLQYVSTPGAAATWVTPGDCLRLLAYAMLLTFAVRQFAEMRRELSSRAVDAERERIARDLHDGLTQDLAVIALHAQAFKSELGTGHPLTIAARRAVAVARGAIVDLSASAAPTMEAALRQVGDELASRFDVEVSVTVAPDGAAGNGRGTSLERDALVRIVREAIVNAAEHGGARHIDVTVERPDSSLRLLIRDDGRGIGDDPTRAGRGFGVPLMRARAELLGGRLTTRRHGDGGTEVEVRIPASTARRAPT